MADGTVGLLPDSTGKKVDVTELTVAGNTVERQRVNISSPTDPNAHAEVMGEPPPNPDSTFALLVRQIQEDNAYTQELLGQIANSLAIAITPQLVGAKGLNVVSSNAANFSINFQQILGAAFNINTVGTGGSAPSFTTRVPVVLDTGFAMPGVPQHIYGGISV